MEFLPFPCFLQLPRIVPHCLIKVQWGTFNWSQTIGGKQNFTYTVPFPIVFSSRKWCMPSIPKVVFGQNGANVQTTYYTNNGVYIHAETGSMQVCAMSAKFDYIAIGV